MHTVIQKYIIETKSKINLPAPFPLPGERDGLHYRKDGDVLEP